jgi:hypothetical protein
MQIDPVDLEHFRQCDLPILRGLMTGFCTSGSENGIGATDKKSGAYGSIDVRATYS